MCKKVAILFVCLGLLSPMMAQKKANSKPFTVVIDAGHGGKDPGAVGKISKEKDLNLNVSLQAGRMIQEAFPEVKVLYTRETDEFLTLQGRADFVNKNNADLFICVHTNSAESKYAVGAETFVLGTDKMEKNLDVAMRENAVIQLESDYQTTYQGFDPNSIDSYIMFELMQNSYMDQSLRFAELVQHQLVDSLHRANRGVKQGALWVLLKSACPSVLIEIGFISNPDEEKYMASTRGQNALARSVYHAFCGFYHRPQALLDVRPEPEEEIARVEQELGQKSQPAPVVNEPVQEPVPVVVPAPEPAQPAKQMYAVQLAARRQPLPPGDPALQGLKCECIQRDGWYKYYYGVSDSENAARHIMKDLRLQFPDCFIIKL